MVLPPPLSVTVAPEIAAPPEALFTVPATAPVVGVRMKLTPEVVVPAVTVAVCVAELKPLAEAVRVWLPGGRPERGYVPVLLVGALAPPLLLTTPPAIAPPDELVSCPVTEPVEAAGLKLRFSMGCSSIWFGAWPVCPVKPSKKPTPVICTVAGGLPAHAMY